MANRAKRSEICDLGVQVADIWDTFDFVTFQGHLGVKIISPCGPMLRNFNFLKNSFWKSKFQKKKIKKIIYNFCEGARRHIPQKFNSSSLQRCGRSCFDSHRVPC